MKFPRKLVLSRKGFDGENGKIASPILPDGRLVPLPIPGRGERLRMRDLDEDHDRLAKMLPDLSRGRLSLDTRVHLDPDLSGRKRLGLKGWRPTLGQTGIAQGHLAKQGIGKGDVFLFFGWFRRVEEHNGRWRYKPGEPNLHLLFGWLEIGEVVPVMTDGRQYAAKHRWIADHPHLASSDRFREPDNTLYVARQRSALGGNPGGGGLFPYDRPELHLTREGSTRSVWQLPAWFLPGRDRKPLTYHEDPGRWTRRGKHCELQSVAKGQEFVLDLERRPEAGPWLRHLISSCSAPAHHRRL